MLDNICTYKMSSKSDKYNLKLKKKSVFLSVLANLLAIGRLI